MRRFLIQEIELAYHLARLAQPKRAQGLSGWLRQPHGAIEDDGEGAARFALLRQALAGGGRENVPLRPAPGRDKDALCRGNA